MEIAKAEKQNIQTDYKAVTELALLTGEILLSCGADTRRAEDTMEYIMNTLTGGTFVVSVLSASIFASFTPDDGNMPVTMMHKINSWSSNMTNVHIANDTSRKFCAGEISVYDAIEILKKAKNSVNKTIWQCLAGYMLTTAFIPLFTPDNLWNVPIAAICGLFLGLVAFLFRKVQIKDFFVNIIMSFTAALIAFAATFLFRVGANMGVIVAACICPMFPGVNIVNAVRDIFHGDYISGSGRLLEAIIKTVGIALGAIGGTSVVIFILMKM